MLGSRSRNTSRGKSATTNREGKNLLFRSLRKVAFLLICITPLSASDTAIFIWNRGGAGHYSVKEARKQEWLKGKVSPQVYDIDLFGDGFINDFAKLGDFSIKLWDGAQRSGNIKLQKRFLDLLGVADVIFHPVIYHKTKKLLLSLDKEPSEIISTQALGIAAVLEAISDVNKKRSWNMKLDLQMIEMPTEQPTYIFKALKKVKKSSKLSKLVTLKSFKPYIKSDLSEKAFWSKYCGDIAVCVSDSFPIRESFSKTGTLIGKEVTLSFIQKHGKLAVPVSSRDCVVTLMLGSQPTHESVLSYLDAMIDLARGEGPIVHFCIYTGHANNKLLKRIVARIADEDIHERLHIVPFTNQKEDVIAMLLARSDVTLTRSGAATTMELLHLNSLQKKSLTLIHAEGFGSRSKVRARRETMSKDEAVRTLLLENGINHWESGNAEYLEREVGAHITHPKYVRTLLKKIWKR